MPEKKDQPAAAGPVNVAGVPMVAGQPNEPVGPEDALGEGPKRGDYSKVMRLEDPHEVVRNPDHDPKDPDSPRTVLRPQAPRVAEVGDAPGKGGVDTASK